MKNKIIQNAVAMLFVSQQVLALGLDLSVNRGEQIITHVIPNKSEKEVCVIPKHYPDADYKKSDFKKENRLCHVSFYPINEEQIVSGYENVAVCAKQNSTNPGVNIFKVKDLDDKAEIEAGSCEDAKGKIAKYKNSTSCSHTSSILSYYHVSRILGNIGQVPVSVLRTMDRENHLAIAQKGVDSTKDLLNKTWTGLKDSLAAGIKSSSADKLLTSTGNQSYGALVVNPKDESFYTKFFNKGPDRAVAFRENNSYFKMVSSDKKLEEFVAPVWDKNTVQILVAMKNMTEFILLDYLLDQQDRFGNIASQIKKAYFLKDDDKDEDSLPEMKIADLEDYTEDLNAGLVDTSKGHEALSVEVMLLKDNDCGVTKTNVVKNAGLLELVRHMNPKTYKKLIKFDRSIDENKDFFISEMQMPLKKFNEFRANVKSASQILKIKCENGELHLDLDVDYYIEHGEIKKTSCEVK